MMTQSLKGQFRLWTVLLVAVPSLLIMTIYTVDQIKVAEKQNLEMISQRVQAQEHLIDYWIKERASDIRGLSQFGAFRTFDEQQVKYALKLMLQANREFDSLAYVNKDGILRISTLGDNTLQPSVIDRPYFQAALEGKEYVSDIITGRISGSLLIAFSSPLYDYAGNFQGVIVGYVKTVSLETLLRDNWIGQTGEVFLVNREGTMLTEPRYANVLIDKGLIQGTAKMKFKITDDAFRNIRLNETGMATWIDYVGNKVLGAYRFMPERGWTLIGKIKEEEVLAPIYTQLTMMAGGTFLVLLLILPLATLTSNRFKRPIEWLVEQSNLVAMEEYAMVGQNKCPEKMPRELSNLCDTFSKMSHKIENTVSLLKEKEARLESKVIEIQDINATLEEEISVRHAAEEALRSLNAELETRVSERTINLQDLNAALEEEISERQTTQEQLRKLNAELEGKVQERTRELREINATLEEEMRERQAAQAEIQGQVELAGTVQKSLLPPDIQDESVTIRTIFKPLTLVSGDFYRYRWSHDESMLHGYLIDVTGHGIATALHTSAISSLMNEAMEEQQPWTEETLTRLNRHLNAYFQDDTFAAFIGFTLDLKNRQLTCVSGGINYVMVSTQSRTGLVKIPGIYLGVTETPEFETVVIPIQHGDTFYFMTDGIYEYLSQEIIEKVSQFDDTVTALKRLTDGKIHDDCSALCIEIRDLKPFPLFFDYSCTNERQCVQKRISAVLCELTGEKDTKIEFALGEALMNAVKHGTNIHVKINKIGHRLILRVKDDGPGFAGNIKVKAFQSVGLEQVFDSLLYDGGGRGIPIMMSWMDKVLYNKQGNEVMLVKYL